MEQQPRNQLPDYMRSPYDPRVLAENINPNSAHVRPKQPWDHIEAALYDPARSEEYLTVANSLLLEQSMSDSFHVNYKAEWTRNLLPLFAQRSQGLNTMTQEDQWQAYQATIPFVRTAMRVHGEAKHRLSQYESSALLGFSGEALTFAILARDSTYNAYPASDREGHCSISDLNHDIVAIGNDGVKVGVESKAYTVDTSSDTTARRREFGVEIFSPFRSSFDAITDHFGRSKKRANFLAAVEEVIGYMEQEARGELTQGSDGKAVLDALSAQLVDRVNKLRETIVDKNGERLPWKGIPERFLRGLPLSDDELIDAFTGYVASKTISVPQNTATVKGEQTIRLSKATRATYNTVSVQHTEALDEKIPGISDGLEEISGHFGVNVNDLEITVRGVRRATTTIRLSHSNETTLEVTRQSAGNKTTYLSHTPQEIGHLIKRLKQFDGQLTWQTPNIEEDTI